MEKLPISNTRLAQFRLMEIRLGNDFDKALATHRAPFMLRMLTWGVSKVVNVATAVASLFHESTRGDLSLLEFELMALGYFMPLKDVVQFDMDIVKLSEELKTILIEMHKAGLIDQPDGNNPLVIEYVRVVNEAEVLAKLVHDAYRRHVVLIAAI